MEVADELKEVPFLLDYDGLVPVLEEMPGPLVAPVERPGVPGEERPHAPGEGSAAGSDQEVEVVREEGPGIHPEGSPRCEALQSAHEVRPVPVIPEDHLPIQPPGHHVVEDAGGIEAGATGHNGREDNTRLL